MEIQEIKRLTLFISFVKIFCCHKTLRNFDKETGSGCGAVVIVCSAPVAAAQVSFPRLCATCGLSLSRVLVFALRVCSPGSLVFLSTKTNTLISNSFWKHWTTRATSWNINWYKNYLTFPIVNLHFHCFKTIFPS